MGYSNCSEAGRAELDEGARYYLTILSPWTLQSADGVPKPGELVPQDGTSWECFVAFMERVGSPKSTFIDCCKGSYLIDSCHPWQIPLKTPFGTLYDMV